MTERRRGGAGRDRGPVRQGPVQPGPARDDLARNDLVRNDLVRKGLVRKGLVRNGLVRRIARVAGVTALLTMVAPWGAPGAPAAAASGTVCGPVAGGGSGLASDAAAPLDARRALWVVQRAAGDVPACTDASAPTDAAAPTDAGATMHASHGGTRPPAWARLDWAVVRPLSDEDACAAGRPPCGPGTLPRTRVLLADASGVRAVVVDADGRVAPDAVDPERDAPPAVPRIERPAPRAVVRAPLVVRGIATGDWYFEGDLPVSVLDARGSLIARGVAVAQGAWMTSAPVPFEATFDVLPATGFPPPALVLERDDPSGIPWHGGALVVPLTAVAP